MSNKSQVYNINNQIDILKNNNINKLSLPATQFTAAKGANLKNLSIGEYKYFIESKKNKLEALNSNNSTFNLNLEKGFTGSGPNLGQGVTDCAGAPQIKIANIFNKYIKAFGGWYNNNVVRGALSALAQGQTASGLQTNRSYLNLVTPVSLKLGSANNINIKYENFQFKKATYNKFIYAMEKATNILILAFKSSGCLISKPIFTVVYNGSGYGPSINASDPRLEGWRSPALNSKGNFNNKFSGCGYGAGATASGSAEIMGGEHIPLGRHTTQPLTHSEYLIGPSAILAFIFKYNFTFVEVLWSFSIFLESVAIIPQLFMLQRPRRSRHITLQR